MQIGLKGAKNFLPSNLISFRKKNPNHFVQCCISENGGLLQFFFPFKSYALSMSFHWHESAARAE